MASRPSVLALLDGTVTSVIHALKAESLLVEPMKVIMQSMTITVVTVAERAAAEDGSAPMSLPRFSLEINANAMTVIPHATYPAQIKTLRLPSLSLRVPMTKVVTTATTALAATMVEISLVVPPNEKRKVLKKLFSTAQATCPMKPKSIMFSNVSLPSFALFSILFFSFFA